MGYETISQNLKDNRYECKITYENGKWIGGTRADYQAENGRLTEAFRLDVKAAYAIEDEKIFGDMFSKAWEDGHASGLYEVLNCFEGLYELMGPLISELMILRKQEATVDKLRDKLADRMAKARRK